MTRETARQRRHWKRAALVVFGMCAGFGWAAAASRADAQDAIDNAL